jgi:hypothetical protein
MKENNNVRAIEEMFSRISMYDYAIKYIEKMQNIKKMLKIERTLNLIFEDGGAS